MIISFLFICFIYRTNNINTKVLDYNKGVGIKIHFKVPIRIIRQVHKGKKYTYIDIIDLCYKIILSLMVRHVDNSNK